MARISDRLKHAWNAFAGSDERNRERPFGETGIGYGSRPERTRLHISNERSIISAIYTRLSVDVASIPIRHVRVDDEGRYAEDVDSGLQNCLTVEANIDQAARDFRQDAALTLFDKGCIALVPVDTSIDPFMSGGFDIKTLRVGEVVAWYPRHVRLSVWNEARGLREEITLEKKFVAIVYNPFYAVMNEPNSTLQRLIRKLNLLDAVDEASSSGKLDLIIQLPYVVRSDARRKQADQRLKDIEFQMKGSKYGIAYTDGTEKVIQLNRPAENNLLKQVEYLTKFLLGQLGLTEDILNGSADEATMINYNNRTIEPVVGALVEAMVRTFLTKTARAQKQTLMPFRDPFKLVSIGDLAEIADKFTRNEILAANEIRSFMGVKPSSDPKADELRNSNMPPPSESETSTAISEEGDSQNGT